MSKQKTVNVDISLDANPLIDETVTKVGSSVADTIRAVWSISFGWIDYYAEKIDIKRKSNLEKYAQLINEEVSKIHPDKIVEPQMSILGPAIQSSEFFFEEEHYREMFSKLIGSSINADKQVRIHPSFVEIIKQLSTNDAIFLKKLASLTHAHMTIAKVQVTLEDKAKGHLSIPESNIIMSRIRFDRFEISTNLIPDRTISSCIDNLNRLGLISFSFEEWITNDHAYEIFRKYNTYQYFVNQFGEERLELKNGILGLTQFGENFISVCVR